ncbi:MAG TPA: type II toxin-antitoxin system RatA family toxin [Pseudolabrys sp.]|nr:type II toxin-antitoxin system RatA family toxin [Pseudolabrys sp.]
MRIERAHSPYTATQLFDLVADVERYPQFLPWMLAARITRRHEDTLWVEMTMGTRLLRRTFSSMGKLERPHRIDITSHDPMFERFQQVWTFEPAADGGTNVEYRVDFKLRSGLLQGLLGGSLADRAPAMMQAFKRRARRLYG